MRGIWRLLLAGALVPCLVPGALAQTKARAAEAATPQLATAREVYRPAEQVYPINDTGENPSQCYQAGGDTLTSCTGTAAVALNPAQDGMIGRDVTHNDPSDGRRGFSFTRLGANGKPVPPHTDQWACIRDNVTGLIWENKTHDGGIHDAVNLYKVDGWPGDVGPMIAATNAEHLCGLTGWRLPTWYELSGIVDYGAAAVPTIDTAYFVTGTNPPGFYSNTYHTSTQSDEIAGTSVYRFGVDFAVGFSWSAVHIASLDHVRLVNGPPLPTANRFRISADGKEVTDTVLGLIWRRCLEGMTWSGSTCTGTPLGFFHEGALARAKTQSGWRLPNIKELSSIVDRGTASPRWDLTLFPGTPQLNAATQGDERVRRPATSTSMPTNFHYVGMISGWDLRNNTGAEGSGVHYVRLVRDVPTGPTPR